MGEGIRSAKVVALLKKAGDRIELDDALCEVETDKAVYPIESSFAGTMGEWKTAVDATVEIGQELGTILTEGGDGLADQMETAAEISADEEPAAPAPVVERKRTISREPALSATITRKLGRVVPANLQIDSRWDAIRDARFKRPRKAMAKMRLHLGPGRVGGGARDGKTRVFRSLILEDDRIVESENFDLGVAVPWMATGWRPPSSRMQTV